MIKSKLSRSLKGKTPVNDAILASYLESADAVLNFLSEGEIEEAEKAFNQLYDQYGGAQTWLNYAFFTLPRYFTNCKKLGDLKHSSDSVEAALLNARIADSNPKAGTAGALWGLGQIKRFLLRNAEAVPLLEEAAKIQAKWPDSGIPIPETITSLAEAAKSDTEKPIALLDCWNTRVDGSLYKDPNNIVSETDLLKV